MKIFISLFLFVAFLSVEASEDIRLMSYNVRVAHEQDADNENNWTYRFPKVLTLIEKHAPELLTFQEPNETQVEDLKNALGHRYEWIHGRASDRAYQEPEKYVSEQHRETQAIAYNRERFELVDSGRFWLAPDPEKEPETVAWDGSPFTRVAVYATLYDRLQQQKITLLTAHFDHKGLQARIESAHLMVKKAHEIAPDHSFFITGDFNTFQNDGGPNVYAAFLKYRHLILDVREAAVAQEGPVSTWVGWDYNSFNEKVMEKLFPQLASRWDQVFVSRNPGLFVKRTAVDDTRFPIEWEGIKKEVYPSDHRPIIVDFNYVWEVEQRP